MYPPHYKIKILVMIQKKTLNLSTDQAFDYTIKKSAIFFLLSYSVQLIVDSQH